jgi:hypothetical protein
MADKLDADTVALEAALKISELFAQDHSGGDVQRTARVQCVLIDAWKAGVQAAADECARRGRAIILDADKAGDPHECERLVTVGFHFWRCAAHIEKLLSHMPAEQYTVPGHDQTIAGLNALSIRTSALPSPPNSLRHWVEHARENPWKEGQ